MNPLTPNPTLTNLTTGLRSTYCYTLTIFPEKKRMMMMKMQSAPGENVATDQEGAERLTMMDDHYSRHSADELRGFDLIWLSMRYGGL